jgi:anthranilate synthase
MESTYTTAGGIAVTVSSKAVDYASALESLLDQIGSHRGAVFASGYEYPGRYSRWDIGFVNPPLQFIGRGRTFQFDALNDRGRELLKMIHEPVAGDPHVEQVEAAEDRLCGTVAPMAREFREEDRIKQPTVLSALRPVIRMFHSPDDSHLGLYGAFGHDLAFQIEPIELRHERSPDMKDAQLYLPDQLVVVDRLKETSGLFSYDFASPQGNTEGLERIGEEIEPKRGTRGPVECDHGPGEYAEAVRLVREECRRDAYFEIVLSQVFSAGYPDTCRELFETIRDTNPSPYEFVINLGDEQLVGASPEMFVRVEGDFVETCPISGTIARGRNAMEDADRILTLLNSKKDDAELTMCTDVDRSDKARVCKPGSVRVVGRRLIELYSRLFHTVDHVAGTLRADCDAFDALLSHLWAVTLIGAPKADVLQRVEDLEKSPREWYGGAVGLASFNGNLNTGITIRTIHLRDGVANVRVGATLLIDSDPDEEDRETRTKASAFVDAVLGKAKPAYEPFVPELITGKVPKVLFVDNKDSFVHALVDYVCQTGAEATTLRAGFALDVLDTEKPDLVFISPGPGKPEDFGIAELTNACVERGIPVFGVALGLQGMVQAFGGSLRVLDYPVHGKPSTIKNSQSGIFEGFPETFAAGRYHSFCANPDDLPSCLRATAHSEDGAIMAVEHVDFPAAGVQFQPESILTLNDELGLKLIDNVVRKLAGGE